MTEEIAHQQLIDYIKDKISITPEQEALIKSRFHLQKLKRKEFFLREGDECYSQGFIVEGTFRVFYIDQKASEHVLVSRTGGLETLLLSTVKKKRT
jgi:hypothetical protein